MIYPLKNWQEIKRGYKFGEKTFYSLRHLGVDYIVSEGTPIYAPINCQIIVSGNFPHGGNTINVSFDDSEYGKLVMRYMHLSKLLPKGNYNEGDILGYTGNTGKYTKGPHLHLDCSKEKVIIKNFNNFIDPDKYFANRMINNSNKHVNMVTYREIDKASIYVLVGDVLIPFATSFEDYKKEFKNAKVTMLSESEFKKFKVSKTVKIISTKETRSFFWEIIQRRRPD